MKLLFIDTETGGLEPGKHSLLSASFGVWESGEITDVLDIHIQEKEYVVTQRALEINKIDLRVPRNGYTTAGAKRAIVAFLNAHYGEEKAVIVGQNIHFDIGFITALFSKADYEVHFSHRTIDTASILRFTDMAGITNIGGSGLSDAIKYFGIQVPEEKRHTSLGDIYATATVFNKLLEVARLQV
jgi:DNA polymerase III subunit epsilon